MRYFLLSVLLLAALSYGVYSQDVGEMTETELLTELITILEEQEQTLNQQKRQIVELQTQLTTADKALTEAGAWLRVSDREIRRLNDLLIEQEQLWQSYREEKEREIRRLKTGLWISVGGNVLLGGYGVVKTIVPNGLTGQ